MKKILTTIFIPFEGSSRNKWIMYASYILIPLIIWMIIPDNTFPPLLDILAAIPKLLTSNNLIGNFIISLLFCFKSMFFSCVIAAGFMLVARIPIFSSFTMFCRKFRFLPSVGLSFIFAKLTDDVNSQMSWMMIFGITTFMVDGAVAIALSITKDDVSYAKTLRLTRWEIYRELNIYSKIPIFIIMAISNFAIAWMLLSTIENIAKASGGIGVVLSESGRYFHLEEVYATQLIILFVGISVDFFGNLLVNLFFPHISLKKA